MDTGLIWGLCKGTVQRRTPQQFQQHFEVDSRCTNLSDIRNPGPQDRKSFRFVHEVEVSVMVLKAQSRDRGFYLPASSTTPSCC